jgi:L-iditol 2-dehydrogenase
MKALVKFSEGREGMGIREVPAPIPGEHDLKVKVSAVGICGTDIHIMRDEYPYNPPMIMGHEYVGVVTEVGSKVTKFEVGDRVISLTAKHTCGKCIYCRQGIYMLCSERKSIGSGMDGAMAEYLVIPERLAYKIPKNLKYGNELALSEPLACCIRGLLERSTITAGDVVLISGPGTIGLLCMQLAKLAGARVVVAGIEKDMMRLKLAKKLGADAVAWTQEQLEDAVYSMNPLGVDVAVECAGVAASVKTCLKMLRKQGQYTQMALYGNEVSLDLNGFLFKEINIYTSYAQEPTSWDRLMSILTQEKLDLKSLFDDSLRLTEWPQAFDNFINQTGFKIAMRP